MGNLTEPIKVRLDQTARRALERRAQLDDRPAAAIARRYIMEGLERDLLPELSPDDLRNLICDEREAGRAFGTLAEACRIELSRRGEPT